MHLRLICVTMGKRSKNKSKTKAWHGAFAILCLANWSQNYGRLWLWHNRCVNGVAMQGMVQDRLHLHPWHKTAKVLSRHTLNKLNPLRLALSTCANSAVLSEMIENNWREIPSTGRMSRAPNVSCLQKTTWKHVSHCQHCALSNWDPR